MLILKGKYPNIVWLKLGIPYQDYGYNEINIGGDKVDPPSARGASRHGDNIVGGKILLKVWK